MYRNIYILYKKAENFIEATSRIELTSRLIPITSDIELESCSDLFDARNYLQLVYLNFLIDIKQSKKNMDINSKMTLVRRLTGRPVHDYCKEIIIDILLLSSECLLKLESRSSSIKSQLQEIFKLLNIELLGSSPDSVTSLREKWQLAEYYCNLFEVSRSAESLTLAYGHIRKNPAPLLYRRICMKLFNNEKDSVKRIMHLFETQSIALRHKACSIQLKQKRKVSHFYRSLSTFNSLLLLF